MGPDTASGPRSGSVDDLRGGPRVLGLTRTADGRSSAPVPLPPRLRPPRPSRTTRPEGTPAPTTGTPDSVAPLRARLLRRLRISKSRPSTRTFPPWRKGQDHRPSLPCPLSPCPLSYCARTPSRVNLSPLLSRHRRPCRRHPYVSVSPGQTFSEAGPIPRP